MGGQDGMEAPTKRRQADNCKKFYRMLTEDHKKKCVEYAEKFLQQCEENKESL